MDHTFLFQYVHTDAGESLEITVDAFANVPLSELPEQEKRMIRRFLPLACERLIEQVAPDVEVEDEEET